MPVAEKLMAALVDKYGPERGKSVYYSMEAEGSGPFGKGKKHRAEHEAFAARHRLPPIAGKKKPATPSRKGRRARVARR
jgi:hypothetical protein